MANLSEIRRSNLLRLRKHMETEYNKKPKNKNTRYTDIIFCEQIKLSPSAFSQLKNSNQKPYFNEVYARKIEKYINLELGWFDVDRDSTDLKSLKINYEQFRKGLLAYHDFTSADIVTINDEQKIDHLIENLFMFLHSTAEINEIEITDTDFFEFMK